MSGSFVNRGSFNNYGKIDPHVQYMYDRQTKARRKRCIIIVACSVILVLATVCLVVGVVRRRDNHSDGGNVADAGLAYGSKAIQAACNSTLYPQVCERDLSSYPGSLSANPRELVIIGVRVALARVGDAFTLANNLSTEIGTGLENDALQDCIELLDDSRDQLNSSILQLSTLSLDSLREQFANVKVHLSTSLSYLSACEDGFSNETGSITDIILTTQQAVSESLANALYLVNTLSMLGKDLSTWRVSLPSMHVRRLLSNGIAQGASSPMDMPAWISLTDRRLLRASTSSIRYNAIVAKDGRGHYRSVNEAVQDAPRNSKTRYVIFIKAGTYKENVALSKNLWNIMFLGEGTDRTIITGNRNVALRNYTTFRSATVAISGKGFIARDITFQNTAGPKGHQAVALRVGADLMVFERCNFEGYQDTLYALSSRQFYRGCKIYGTVDFIFGNAAAVFQNCELLARLPMQGQQNTYTAQGRKLDGDETGFSFQNCTLSGTDGLNASTHQADTYLGRPWKAYSRTVFVKSYLSDLIHPDGWLSWNASNPFITTIYFGEYANTGPGSGTTKRVNWPGVHPRMTLAEAQELSVENLFVETSWLGDASVEFEKSVA